MYPYRKAASTLQNINNRSKIFLKKAQALFLRPAAGKRQCRQGQIKSSFISGSSSFGRASRLSRDQGRGAWFYILTINASTVLNYAEVAHLVEHDLAKVGVAGSSPVFRSKILLPSRRRIFFGCPGGGIGRHAGLKILWPAMAVSVQLRSGAQL
jgi:hypothetical protein